MIPELQDYDLDQFLDGLETDPAIADYADFYDGILEDEINERAADDREFETHFARYGY